MIQANELRVGNYYDHNGEYRKVTPSTIEEVWNAERTWCKPIPITEDILLKCGFEKFTTKDIYPTYVNKLFNWNDGILFLVGYNFINHIKYLHDLQNLYFALTKTELTINL